MMVKISLSHNFCDKFDAQNQIKITHLTQKTGTDVGIMAEKVCKLYLEHENRPELLRILSL